MLISQQNKKSGKAKKIENILAPVEILSLIFPKNEMEKRGKYEQISLQKESAKGEKGSEKSKSKAQLIWPPQSERSELPAISRTLREPSENASRQKAGGS